MKDTILLTGCAGFVGWKTAAFLLRDGYRVLGIDNLNDYYDSALKEYRLEELNKHEQFSFFKLDIENRNALEDLFEKNKIDAVINLAARAGVRYSIKNPRVYFSTNLMGTLNLLELMSVYGTDKFVLASTSSLYAGQKMPFGEDLPVNTPISPYAASKKAAESISYTYHHLYGIHVAVLRYFTVYGPAGRPDMSIFRFVKWIEEGSPVEIYGDGSQSRGFTYIDDIARGTAAAAGLRKGYQVINLGSSKPCSLNRVISIIENCTGKKAVRRHSDFLKVDMKKTSASIEKAAKMLCWKPEVGIEEGIRATVCWHKKNSRWLKNVKL